MKKGTSDSQLGAQLFQVRRFQAGSEQTVAGHQDRGGVTAAPAQPGGGGNLLVQMDVDPPG